MKRFLVILSVLFTALSVSAKTPDNDRIFAAINNVDSPLYYPNLMLRYKEGKPMTEEEYHHLYYGYAFQPSYKPLEVNQSMNRVQEIMARISIDTPSVRDIDELIAAGVPGDLVRLSCGLESYEDLIEDIQNALQSI